MTNMRSWQTIFDVWRLGPIRALAQPDSGTVNEIVRVTTDAGDYFLRAYRHPERAPIEHAVIAHAQARGLPAVGPLPLPDGATLLERDGCRYALYPRAPGRQSARSDLSAGEVAAMGGFLATLHLALRDFPLTEARRGVYPVDRAATLAGIARLEETIHNRPGTDPLDTIALARLAARRTWLEGQTDKAAVDQVEVNEQLIHGDYQESNLFFDTGRVSAVIDWDQVHVASRALEILRTLDFVFAFAPTACRTFLTAYRAVQPLSKDDLDRGAATYGLKQAHNLWIYNAYFLEGNERVGRFITPGGFVPFTDRWATLGPALVDE